MDERTPEPGSFDRAVLDVSALRAARIARGLSEKDVAERTKLSPRMVAAIEEGQFEKLPGGIYARVWIRAYADAVGLADPSLIQELIGALPNSDPADIKAIAVAREKKDPSLSARGSSYRTAAILDAAVVLGISIAGVLICALLAGGTTLTGLELAISFFALATPTLVLYVGLLGAPGVGTVGARLLEVEFVPRVSGPVDGAELLRRTREYFRSVALALLTGKIA
jgi:transcriptional regulator with XRE-family HTH domain